MGVDEFAALDYGEGCGRDAGLVEDLLGDAAADSVGAGGICQDKGPAAAVREVVGHICRHPAVSGIENAHFGFSLSREINIKANHNVGISSRVYIVFRTLGADRGCRIPTIGAAAAQTPGVRASRTRGASTRVDNIRDVVSAVAVIEGKTEGVGLAGIDGADDFGNRIGDDCTVVGSLSNVHKSRVSIETP